MELTNILLGSLFEWKSRSERRGGVEIFFRLIKRISKYS